MQDRSFEADGAFDGGVGEQFVGGLGDTILVNGTIGPFLDVTTERVRLRLLNGSSARMYDFASPTTARSTLDRERRRAALAPVKLERSRCRPASGRRSW